MKHLDLYKCEICGFESQNAEDVLSCEAKHLGLTVKEKEEYNSLKSYVAYMGTVVNRTKNERTESAFDEAIQKLLDFENAHHLIKETK